MIRMILCVQLLLLSDLVAAQSDSTSPPEASDTRDLDRGGDSVRVPISPKGQIPEHRLSSSANRSVEVVPGSILVHVRDGNQQPVVRASLVLVMLAGDGDRREIYGRTDEKGLYVFSNLSTQGDFAYRVSHNYRSVHFSSPPFKLPDDVGYEVNLYRLDTTFDDTNIFLSRGQLSIQLLEDRLRVGQVTHLVNLSQQAYLFPNSGLAVKLPEGYTGFQSSPAMGDQHVSEIDREGIRITGSLMPGSSMFYWQYDLLLSGSEMSFSVDLPWKTMGFQVVAEVGSGMTLAVEQMPEPNISKQHGLLLAMTEIQRTTADPLLHKLDVSIKHIPGSSYIPWIALFISLLIITVGGVIAVFRPLSDIDYQELLAYRECLLGSAIDLHSMYKAGKLDEINYQKRYAAVLDELSVLLYEIRDAEISFDSGP